MTNKSEELIRFCQMLTTAVKCGKPLPQALLSLKPVSGNDKAVAWCNSIGRKMSEGYAIETAVSELSGFDPTLARLLPLLGENRLLRVLESYTRYLVVLESLNQRLSAAIAYPFLLLLLMNLNFFHLNFFLFPRAYSQMQAAHQDPSLLMRLLYFVNPDFWPLSLVVPGLFFICLAVMIRQFFKGLGAGKTIWGEVSGMNSIVAQQEAARVQACLCLYLESGYSLEKSMRMTGELLDDRKNGLMDTLAALESGMAISEAFALSPVLRRVYLADDSGEGLVEALQRCARSNFRSSMARMKNVSGIFAVLALLVASLFVLSVTSGFFDTYYWLMWSY